MARGAQRRRPAEARGREGRARLGWCAFGWGAAWLRGRGHGEGLLARAREPGLPPGSQARVTQPRQLLLQQRGWAAVAATLLRLPLGGLQLEAFRAPGSLAHERRRRLWALALGLLLLALALGAVERLLRPQAVALLLGLAPAGSLEFRPHRGERGRLHGSLLLGLGLLSQRPLLGGRLLRRWPGALVPLARRRRLWLPLLLLLAAAVTPPDVLSQLLVAGPRALLLEGLLLGLLLRGSYGVPGAGKCGRAVNRAWL